MTTKTPEPTDRASVEPGLSPAPPPGAAGSAVGETSPGAAPTDDRSIEMGRSETTAHPAEIDSGAKFISRSPEKRARQLANLRPGDTGTSKAARLKAHEDAIAAAVEAELAGLPGEMRDNPTVRKSVDLKCRAESDVRDYYARRARGERITEREGDRIVKLAGLIQSYASDLLSRWPRQDASSRPVRRIPKSVADWLERIEEVSGPVEIVEDGSAPADRVSGWGSTQIGITAEPDLSGVKKGES